VRPRLVQLIGTIETQLLGPLYKRYPDLDPIKRSKPSSWMSAYGRKRTFRTRAWIPLAVGLDRRPRTREVGECFPEHSLGCAVYLVFSLPTAERSESFHRLALSRRSMLRFV